MDLTALYKISSGVYVIGTKLDGKDAGCTVDAFIQSTNSPVPTVILCSIQANQTNKAIKQTGEFTVSVLPTDVDPFIIANFGFQSGRDSDKWANVEHKYVGGLPVLERYDFLRPGADYKGFTHTAFSARLWTPGRARASPIWRLPEFESSVGGFKAFKEYIYSQQEENGSARSAAVYSDVPFEELPEDYKCPYARPKR